MKRSDILFLIILFVGFLSIPLRIKFNSALLGDYLSFWWLLGVPYIILLLFFRKSKLYKWLQS